MTPPASGGGKDQTPEGRRFVEPPVSGGTLLVTPDGKRAIVSDPARDQVFVVELSGGSVHAIDLNQGDEPGRAAIDDAGNAHVVLRGASQILTINLGDLTTSRQKTCTGPRGIAFDAANNRLHVVGVRGDVWSSDAATGKLLRKIQIDPDLRDVVVRGDRLFVTTFRSAELLVVEADGSVSFRTTPPIDGFTARVAWRMIPIEGGVAIVHQGASSREIETGPTADPGEYQAIDDCHSALVTSAVTVYRETPGGTLELSTLALPFLSLPVDLAVSPDASELTMTSTSFGAINRISIDALQSAPLPCHLVPMMAVQQVPVGDVVAATYAGTKIVVQTREPASLRVLEGTQSSEIPLGGKTLDNVAYGLFHRGNAPFPTITCASCHPEGREDGHVWRFTTVGSRRTQSLLGGVAQTAPFHWDGDLADMNALMTEVFEKRMGQQPLDFDQLDKVIDWIDGLAPLPSPRTRETGLAAGRAAFEKAGCADCHEGERLQGSGSHDVGTGKPMQVPSLLGVGARAPLMHDGCAATLEARFEDETCGGNDHGNVGALSDAEMADLLRYLREI